MPTNTMTIDEIEPILASYVAAFDRASRTNDRSIALDIKNAALLEAKQSLNALILAELTELINSQKPIYIFSAANGKEDTAINKAELLAVAQCKYGGQK